MLDQSSDGYRRLFSFESYSMENTASSDASIYLEALTQAALAQHIRHSSVAPQANIKRQFFLGPALSGAPFHHHGPALNAVVYVI